MNNEIIASQPNKEVIEKSCQQTQAIFSELSSTKEALVEKELGEDTYQTARTLINALIRPENVMGKVSDETREQLAALDKAQYTGIVRDALNLEPTDDDGYYRRNMIMFICEHLYPDTTLLSLLDDEEKLGEIAVRLKNMEDDDAVNSHPAIEEYEKAQIDADKKIRDIYMEITGNEDIEQIYSDEMTFDIDFKDQGTGFVSGTQISITKGKLVLNSQKVTKLSEVDEVVDTTLPLTAVIEVLQNELTESTD